MSTQRYPCGCVPLENGQRVQCGACRDADALDALEDPAFWEEDLAPEPEIYPPTWVLVLLFLILGVVAGAVLFWR